MKQTHKTTVIALLLAAALLLTACGSDASAAAGEETQSPITAAENSLLSVLGVPAPDDTILAFLKAVYDGDLQTAAGMTADGSLPWATNATSTEAGLRLRSTLRAGWSYVPGTVTQDGKKATACVHITGMSLLKAASAAFDGMQSLLSAAVEAADSTAEIYDSDRNFRPELLQSCYETLYASLLDPSACAAEYEVSLSLAYTDGSWRVTDTGSLEAAISGGSTNLDADAQALYDTAVTGQPYIRKHYTLPEDSAVPGNVPAQENFGCTSDPSVVEALLERPEAQALINGQEVCWNADIEFFPDSEIRYYLDETILMIQWQEVTAKAVGTYAEVFLADASQIRRKFVNDVFGGWDFDVATNLAQQTNAVLATGGDLYNHARECGIVVYNREIYRFDPDTCDTCYIDTSGNMHFSKRGQFTEQWEAEQFVEENDILFSLCFGPVMIEYGQDVTPDYYQWGEINDTYARAALGQFGELHYLTLNINCGTGAYYYLATLQDATDAMLAHGVPCCYALDGGQTAETIVNGEMINPVQFGQERNVSDILYFATAMPSAS